MNIGKTIQGIRKQKNITQKELSAKCGITQTYLSQIENNVKDTNIKILKRIAEELGISLPIIIIKSLDSEDVPSKKQEAFNLLQPLFNNLFDSILEDE